MKCLVIFIDVMLGQFTKFHYFNDITSDDLSIQHMICVGCALNIFHSADFNHGYTRSKSHMLTGSIGIHSCTDRDNKSNKDDLQ